MLSVISTGRRALFSPHGYASSSAEAPQSLREAAGILELNPGIDRGYIEHWASRLGAAGLWQQVGPSR
jgi:hypothetical protein